LAEKSRAATVGLLLGRRTYEHIHSYWPSQTDNPFTEVLTNTRKYVTSRTLQEPLPWDNSTLLDGDAADAVARLKEQLVGDLVVLGSGDLVNMLNVHALVDEYALLIHPLALGSGRRLFAEPGTRAAVRLIEAKVSPSGVVVTTYQPADVAAQA
jgi:dihydrofolate reductase